MTLIGTGLDSRVYLEDDLCVKRYHGLDSETLKFYHCVQTAIADVVNEKDISHIFDKNTHTAYKVNLRILPLPLDGIIRGEGKTHLEFIEGKCLKDEREVGTILQKSKLEKGLCDFIMLHFYRTNAKIFYEGNFIHTCTITDLGAEIGDFLESYCMNTHGIQEIIPLK